MSRISYSEDESYPGQFNLWRANVNRSVSGKKGQQALRDLEAALLAMTDKRLAAHTFINDESVCAVGALVVARRVAAGESEEEVKQRLRRERMYCASCNHTFVQHEDGPCSGCTRQADWRVEFYEKYPEFKPSSSQDRICLEFTVSEDVDKYSLDDEVEGDTEAEAVKVGVPELVAWRLVELNDFELDRDTPEQRYEHVLQWVQRRLTMPLAQQQREDMS